MMKYLLMILHFINKTQDKSNFKKIGFNANCVKIHQVICSKIPMPKLFKFLYLCKY